MIVIPLPDPLDHHAFSLAKLVAATSWLSSANVVRAAGGNLSQEVGRSFQFAFTPQTLQ